MKWERERRNIYRDNQGKLWGKAGEKYIEIVNIGEREKKRMNNYREIII